MITPSRPVLSASAALAAALLLAGCASSPGDQSPTSSPGPDDSAASTAPVSGDDVEAAWLDDGRMVGIVTWGSSTCIPVVGDITAEGQRVTVALVDAPSGDGSEQACTADLAPRASIAALPAGVDPTQDVELVVTIGDVTDDVDLDGDPALTGVPGESTDFAPSAGWYDDEGIVLLTWGSSTCPPAIENIEQQAGGATVTFVTEDGVCTMDMVPRGTVVVLGDDTDDDDGFVLTLVGDNLDGTVDVVRG